ncbi:hypothetical protein GWR56_08175 [Mucilaginibacter sp. 14171R-50]|uniref:hypothetical protein n=1 Tax=Mucilaginibacter sp. 14171R-50 TaxID=2703789 RepID=UPI00138CD37A|nr:hypothetical protein [Mucilaginibacter sp. 14171R-50]QHS55516.1 hypothetical protein GWR56_08175 [Mucilaginibacter sp. 14171R-50]
MKKFYCVAILVLHSLCLSAQSNYKPGYLLNNNGDTTRGYINYREWGENPATIEFKAALNSDKSKITPADVAGFEIAGLAAYKTYNGPVSTDEISGDRLPDSRDTSFTNGQIFLKVLQKGNIVTLYSYQDRIKARYFISEGSQGPTELIYRTYHSTDRQNSSIEENTYRKQLSVIASKNNLLDAKLNIYIQRSEYSYPGMLSIVSKLNNFKTVKEDNTIKANYFYAGAGVNVALYQTRSVYNKVDGQTHTSVLPRVTGGFNFFMDQNTQALAFRIELGVGANKYESYYPNLVSPSDEIVYHFTQIMYSIEPEVLYNLYNAQNFKFYSGLGFQMAYAQYVDKGLIQKNGSDFDHQPDELFRLNKYFTSFALKAGIIINKKIDISVAYLTTSDVNSNSDFFINNNFIQAGINYSFK